MIVTLKQNGYGLRYGTTFEEKRETVALWFDSAPELFMSLQETQSITLSGEPGAGKSHIAEDIFRLALAEGLGAVMLSTHINAGSQKGRATTSETLATAEALGDEAVVIFDNLDFAIYTGGSKKRRTKKQTVEYCDFITESYSRCIDAGCIVLATIHSEEWRTHHSEAPIDAKAKFATTIEQYGGAELFSGCISAENVYRLLCERGIASTTASAITNDLDEIGFLTFRQAYHIDPEVYKDAGIVSAVKRVEQLKEQKIQGGA